MAQPSPQTSTSADAVVVDFANLGVRFLGTQIRVIGRDITLGPHTAPPVEHEGELEAIHANRQRVRVVLLIDTPHTFKTPRVIEVMV